MTAKKSYLRKMIVALLLIAAGVAMTGLGDETTGAVLVMTGLTVGGWTQGLHTPAPVDDADLERWMQNIDEEEQGDA